MDGSYLADPLTFLVQVLLGAYALALMLRFLLQLTRADFHNPVSQFLVKVTTPLLRPLRRVIPGYRGLDTASLVAVWAVKSLEVVLLLLLAGAAVNPFAALLWSIPEILELCFDIFLFAILIQVILSWVNPGGYSPAASLIDSLTAPVMNPLRRLIPPIGGLDLSPMAAVVGLILLEKLLLPPIRLLVSTPFR